MNEAESLPPLPALEAMTKRVEVWGLMQDYARQAVAAEREKAAAFADSWSKPSVVKLAAGEMSAQELRTAQAVARGIAAAIRSAK